MKNEYLKKELSADEILIKDLLYDFYGELLSDRQKRIYEEVVFNDYSISEVAKDEGISRQSVSDMIKRCNNTLLSYENKLGLVNKFINTKKLIAQIKILSKNFLETKDISNISQIDKISDEILEL